MNSSTYSLNVYGKCLVDPTLIEGKKEQYETREFRRPFKNKLLPL